MASTQIAERRRSPRRKPEQLVYIEFGRDNGGMIKDVSADGMRFFLMNPVVPGYKLAFGMTIDAGRRIEGEALIVWTDPSGKSGGLSFVALSPVAQETLRGWLVEMDGPPPPPPATIPQPAAVAVAVAPPALAVEAPPPSISDMPAPASPAEATVPVATAPPVLAEMPEPALAPPPPAALSASLAERLLPAPAGRPPAPPANVTTSVVAAMLPALSSAPPRLATRDEWRRAAREGLSPVEKVTPEEMLAGIAEPSAAARPLVRSQDVPPDVPVAPQVLESAVPLKDPLHAFLTPPIRGEKSFLESPFREPPFLGESVLEDSDDHQTLALTRTTSVLSRSRLAMILALAAICGAAASFAAIAYRRTVGESLIAIGEKISGEPRPVAATNLDPANPSAPPASSEDARSVPPRDVAPSAAVKPPDAAPVVEPSAPDAALVKSKPLPTDISALWLAVQNGDAAAEVALADRYIFGRGVVKNCDQARVLLEAAVKRGSTSAAKRLAELRTLDCS